MTLGDILIGIGADPDSWQELQKTLDDGQQQVTEFAAAVEEMGPSLEETFALPAEAIDELESQLDGLAATSETTAESIGGVATSLEGVSDSGAFTEIATEAGSAGTSVDALVDTLDELVRAGQESEDTFEQALSVYNDAVDAFEQGSISAQVLESALEQLADAADNVGAVLPGVNDQTKEAGDDAEHASEGMGELAEALIAVGEALVITEALKELGEEAIEVYGQTQQFATSLKLLGDTSEEAEEKISELSDMSLNLAVPFGTLEQAARRLTVAMQGVEGLEVTDVLTAAANSAALTGRSFDTVTSALQRIEITGQVTSRQLVNLGVTFDQLAATAGVSVDEVTELLKKGGQSATEDLQLVINTINSMASNAAAAQAQTVLGQITVLKNQVELLFDAIGQDAGGAIANVVSVLSNIVQVARQVVVAFQELPVPIQDVILTVTLLAAAIVPVTAAVGALIISVGAVGALFPAFIELMTTLGLAAGEEAAAEGAAAEATAAHGIAAAAAIGPLEGLAAAEGEGAIAAGALEGGAEAAGLGLSAIGGYAAIVVVALAGFVAGMKDVVANAVSLKGTVSELGSGFNALGGQAEIFSQGLSAIGLGGDHAKEGMDDATEAGELLTAKMEEIGTYLASGLWDSFKNEMTGEVAPAIQFVNVALQELASSAGIDIVAVGQIADAMKKAFASAGAEAGPSAQQVQQGVEQELAAFNKLQTAVQTTDAVYTAMLKSFSTGTPLAGTTIVATMDMVEAALNKNASAIEAYNKATDDGTLSTDKLAKAVKAAPDSWEALTDAVTKQQNALQQAQDTFDAVSSAYNAGKTVLDGLAINLQTVTDAQNNLNKAFLAAVGIVPAWSASSDTIAAGATTQFNAFQKMQNAVSQTEAVLKAYQDSANNNVVIPGTNIVATQAMVSAAFLDNQKAVETYLKATDASAYSIADVTGKAADLSNAITVNGQVLTDVAKGFDDAGASTTAFTGFVTDGTAKIGDMTITTEAAAVGLGAEADALNKDSVAVTSNTTAVTATTAAKKAAQDASAQLAAQTQKENQAWADGKIVMENYAGVLVEETTAATDSGTAASEMQAAIASARQTMTDSVTASNSYATSLGNIATQATNATGAVGKLGAAAKQAATAMAAEMQTISGGAAPAGSLDGGIGGGSASYSAGFSGNPAGLGNGDAAASEMYGTLFSGAGVVASLGQQTTAGVSAGSNTFESPDSYLQGLANATNEVVTSLYGTFIPATQQAATLLAAQNVEQAKNTAATTANTAATASNTDATAAATTTASNAVKQLAENVIATTDAAGNVTLAITDATGAVTDFSQSAADAAAGNQEFTSASAPTIQALQALNQFLGQSSSVTALNTAATDSSTQAIAQTTQSLANLATVVGQAGNTISNLGQVAQQAGQGFSSAEIDSQSLAAAMQVATADMLKNGGAVLSQGPGVALGGPSDSSTGLDELMGNGAVIPMIEQSIGATMGMVPGSSSWQYTNPNPGLMEGYAPPTGSPGTPAPAGLPPIQITMPVVGSNGLVAMTQAQVDDVTNLLMTNLKKQLILAGVRLGGS